MPLDKDKRVLARIQLRLRALSYGRFKCSTTNGAPVFFLFSFHNWFWKRVLVEWRVGSSAYQSLNKKRRLRPQTSFLSMIQLTSTIREKISACQNRRSAAC
ncbi:hypothetical protein VTK73DRAFT_7474 [Phialemonium thermophilum]|uniref:Uncharacterized protein n=1 Tax=Phialemonium thermophilum TaxID=223376 RepID=A0ABR3XS51_9PEZI